MPYILRNGSSLLYYIRIDSIYTVPVLLQVKLPIEDVIGSIIEQDITYKSEDYTEGEYKLRDCFQPI